MITTLLRVSRALQISRLRVWGILIRVFFIGFLTTDCWSQNQNILWSENWERTNWTDDWHVDAGTWEVGKPTSGPNKANNGLNCAATVLAGNYPEPTNTRLIRHTPFVVPPASENPRLRYWHWLSFGGDDYGEVQIKVGNNDWKPVAGPYVNTGSGVWTCPSIDLSDYSGATIQIAFFLHSQPYWNGANTSSSGWYIDDLALITGPIKFNLLENWEAGLGDWYADKGTWQVGKPTTGPQSAYSGQNCAATVLEGNYWEPLDTRLISPRFVVPRASSHPRLRFWHWFSFGGDDYGQVHIKVGRSDWKIIAGSYVNTSSGVWTYPSIELSAYADSTIQIAFYLHSQPYWNGANTASSGWYIDDVALITGSIKFNPFENWEAGLGDWHADKGTWQVGKPTSGPNGAYSGQNCAATVLAGNYWEPVDASLISPVFVVASAAANPALRFWHWFSFGGDDAGYVQIKIGNEEWKTIFGPLVNTSGGIWTPVYIPLADYANKSVQIAFYLHSQPYWNGANTSSTGWYIDDLAIGGLATSIDDQFSSGQVISSYALLQNYPNPFNPATMIEYELPRAGQIEITIFNLLGEKVRALVNHHQASGQYRVQWDGRDDNGKAVTSGVYLYRLRAENFVQTRKMILAQ